MNKMVVTAIALSTLLCACAQQQAEQAPVSATPVASVPRHVTSVQVVAPEAGNIGSPLQASGPEFLLHMTPDKTCAVLSGAKLSPFDPVKPDDKPTFGQYIEQTQAVNGKVKEHHLAVYDGRQWWDLSGIQECGK